MNFNVALRLTLGISGGGGYISVSQGSDMTYENLRSSTLIFLPERKAQ